MLSARTCPRCGREARPPGLWASAWTCVIHGEVAPVHPLLPPSSEGLHRVAKASQVPVWVPWPLPEDWLVTGVRWAGDERNGPVAVVVAVSGPNPLPGVDEADRVADLLVLAEQPGVGLGARLVGLADVDGGAVVRDKVEHGPAEARVSADGHDIPLWAVSFDSGVGYVGEAGGVWLWLLTCPATAGALLLGGFSLLDARGVGAALEFPVGALTPRLAWDPAE